MKADLQYESTALASELVDNYICSLRAREPTLKHSKIGDYEEWSAAKVASETILERINQGFDPVMVVEEYAIQMDYFSYKAGESGNYVTSRMFEIGSDVALDLLSIFADYDIHTMEEFTNE